MSLAALIELPAFPPVTPDCLLHPALLTLRYLMDANLPGEFARSSEEKLVRVSSVNLSLVFIFSSVSCLFVFFSSSFLSDKLHALVREVIQKTSMGTDSFLTFDPTERKPRLPCYDLQAAALIVVCMKLLFRLDDNVEW